MSTTLSAPEKTRPRQRWTMKEARAVLAELAKSRLSPREFAAREGLDVQRLHSWRRKLESRPTFVEVRSAPERIEIELRSGHVLRVSEAIAPSALRRMIEALEPSRTPC